MASDTVTILICGGQVDPSQSASGFDKQFLASQFTIADPDDVPQLQCKCCDNTISVTDHGLDADSTHLYDMTIHVAKDLARGTAIYRTRPEPKFAIRIRHPLRMDEILPTTYSPSQHDSLSDVLRDVDVLVFAYHLNHRETFEQLEALASDSKRMEGLTRATDGLNVERWLFEFSDPGHKAKKGIGIARKTELAQRLKCMHQPVIVQHCPGPLTRDIQQSCARVLLRKRPDQKLANTKPAGAGGRFRRWLDRTAGRKSKRHEGND